MASSDRWVWLGIGFLTVVAVKSISYALQDVVHLTEIQDQKPVQGVSKETEDAIKLESLYLLATCHNSDIRTAALKIFCDRFSQNDEARLLLIRDLGYESNPAVREKACRALNVLEKYDPSHTIHQLTLPFMDPSNSGPRARTREESPEEMALRRRRREAMVLNEGDHPVRQDDIIQRGGRPRDDETARTERALASLSEGRPARTNADNAPVETIGI